MKKIKPNILNNKTNDVSEEKLEDQHQPINSMIPENNLKENLKDKIMSFAGVFNEFSEEDYFDYINFIKKERSKIFNRNSAL